jgi:hypothetical protein
MIRPLVALVLMFWSCCAAISTHDQADVQAQSALDVMKHVVPAAGRLSRQGCVAKQDLELEAVRKGQQTTAQAEPKLLAIQKTCESLHEIFERIRAYHSQAVDAYNKGAIQDARQSLKDAQELFDTVSEKLGGEP